MDHGLLLCIACSFSLVAGLFAFAIAVRLAGLYPPDGIGHLAIIVLLLALAALNLGFVLYRVAGLWGRL